MLQDPLALLIQKKCIPHALIVVDGTKRAEAFARELLQTQVEHHPDLHCLHPDEKSGLHPIEKIRQLTEEIALHPFEAPYKVALIYAAEKMLPTSSNALLKMFEEPTSRTVLILLTHHREKIIPTILSRCHTFFYQESLQQFPALDATISAMKGEITCFAELETLLDQSLEAMDTFLELVMRIARDVSIRTHDLSDRRCFFSAEIVQGIPFRSLNEFDQRIRRARLSFDRGVKSAAILSYLFLST